MRRWLCLVLAAGCGDNSHGHPVDAPADMAVVGPTGPHYHYVSDKVYLPATNQQAQQYGLDLSGDGMVDNQLGMVMASLAGQGQDIQTPTDKSIDTGTTIDLLDIQTADFSNAASAGFNLLIGANPSPAPCNGSADTVCRHHLDGTGSFDLAQPPEAQLVGSIANGTLETHVPGHMPVQFPILDAPPISLIVIAARVRVTGMTATGVDSAIVAGAITKTDVDGKIVPALQYELEAAVMRDCTMLSNPPSCGCASGSDGESAITTFDTSHDCMVSVDEVAGNAFIQALLQPDMVVEGQMAMSVGVMVHAVSATFTVPGE